MKKLILISLVIVFSICSKSWAGECEESPANWIVVGEDPSATWNSCTDTLKLQKNKNTAKTQKQTKEKYLNKKKADEERLRKLKTITLEDEERLRKKREAVRVARDKNKYEAIIKDEQKLFENAKLECEAIGYKKGTEKFGECVLDLTE